MKNIPQLHGYNAIPTMFFNHGKPVDMEHRCRLEVIFAGIV
jgi:hypothetical protein